MRDDSTKRRKRGPSLSRELAAAHKAGQHVISSCRHPDGSIELRFGEPVTAPPRDPWQVEIERLTKQ
jgi:hypothetical protein